MVWWVADRGPDTEARQRLLSHGQFEELRRYEDGHAHYVFRSPPKSLTVNGWLSRVPDSGETRASSAWRITDAGRAALVAYRVKWAVSAPDVRELRHALDGDEAATAALDRLVDALAAGVGVPTDADLVSAPAKERQDAREEGNRG